MAGAFFDAAKVTAGIYTAMQFGAPNKSSDQATFYMPLTPTTTGPQDAHGVPFSPSNARTFGSLTKLTVPCAIEFLAGVPKTTNLGILEPDELKITFLGPDYLKVKGAEYVVVGGDQYIFEKAEPVYALGNIDVYTTYWKANTY